MDGWPLDERTELEPLDYLNRVGAIFATFDARTQDSGNVSFGVEAADGRRWFVKTAGDPADPAPFLPHVERVALLANALRLAGSVAHPALVALNGVVPSAWGPMLVYDWVVGDLIRTPEPQRGDPASAFQRFRRLPPTELAEAMDAILDLHVALCGAGWIACDFYDGSLMYDFASRTIRVIDLDSYHAGPFTNEMGRMFGSTRFMAPEEFELGARIDERTTVFNLGRAISVLLGDGGLGRPGFRGSEDQHQTMVQACLADPAARFQSVAALVRAWRG